MLFIHQFPDWTHFRFDSRRVLDALGKARYTEGRLSGLLAFASSRELETTVVVEDIVASYAIDGITLDAQSVRKDVELRSKGNSPDIKVYLGAIENFANPFTRERLLTYFSYQYHKQGSRTFKIAFNRQQLADYLSVDRSALSNELSKMQRDGLISIDKHTFRLLTLPADI